MAFSKRWVIKNLLFHNNNKTLQMLSKRFFGNGMRPKREDMVQIESDSSFSKWKKILVGPTDWKNYDMGKEGVPRYRIQNLPPAYSVPGIYELGIGLPATDEADHLSCWTNFVYVISAYLGHTGDLRKRLQEHGRGGSHLEKLFQETVDKNKAAELETQKLSIHDYPWNNARNGPVRQDDILKILNKIHSTINCRRILTDLQNWLWKCFKRHVGPSKDIHSIDPECKIGFSVFKTFRNCHSLVHDIHRLAIQSSDTTNESYIVNRKSAICGFVRADGSVCGNAPVLGRKRCKEHKGRRIRKLESSLVVTPIGSS
ncbi:hypothetical protein QJS10_CPB04g00685 [Acorus calamus]|uniref:GIY-YIG domain-containing protein n=1 Tax=Acorus calamus TaxID=4465 RepID=A0AAV9F1A7_ACOCL|nr:hypothetical protein QJS10_CPB04g00685 [Acorus calamus]